MTETTLSDILWFPRRWKLTHQCSEPVLDAFEDPAYCLTLKAILVFCVFVATDLSSKIRTTYLLASICFDCWRKIWGIQIFSTSLILSLLMLIYTKYEVCQWDLGRIKMAPAEFCHALEPPPWTNLVMKRPALASAFKVVKELKAVDLDFKAFLVHPRDLSAPCKPDPRDLLAFYLAHALELP